MASNVPPDDFSNQPTQHANFGALPRETAGPIESEPFEPEPLPWYRKPRALIAWALFVLVLIALIIYGILQLIKGGPSRPTPTPTPSPTSTTTTTPRTTTPVTTTTAPTSATTPAPPPPATGPVTQPPQRPPEQLPHRPHLPEEIPRLPPLPSVITLPQMPTVITLPPGL
ncbi:hypothetical protein [Mycobacterium botniense]|uniref:Uncharacterized protein n=1 Tax=Mycobacterium botniense TaxID=84962 RepID=A0A7I9XU92_9MYCO|nr:hypothetical protein [Mycobacterium botniense]GFG73571.1 hypothetical protein MBOT_09360 [Mycobacterium botniense]